jgi:hypothetical protein
VTLTTEYCRKFLKNFFFCPKMYRKSPDSFTASALFLHDIVKPYTVAVVSGLLPKYGWEVLPYSCTCLTVLHIFSDMTSIIRHINKEVLRSRLEYITQPLEDIILKVRKCVLISKYLVSE